MSWERCRSAMSRRRAIFAGVTRGGTELLLGCRALAGQIPQASFTAFHPCRHGEGFPDSGAHSDWGGFPFFVFLWLVGWVFFFLFGGGFGGCFLQVGLGELFAFLMLSSLVLGSRG